MRIKEISTCKECGRTLKIDVKDLREGKVEAHDCLNRNRDYVEPSSRPELRHRADFRSREQLMRKSE